MVTVVVGVVSLRHFDLLRLLRSLQLVAGTGMPPTLDPTMPSPGWPYSLGM